ncbi:RNA polymerase sigma factor SigM [Desertihabitans brevis]|uniref:RNA polymerase sigma factor SigM n=1 Tax=Desertihabitans brevis TaxID=2268447 RepID=A0A367YWP1_9ACTN|nr:RNA polymerase sigma factor SigM [Desertihabitans brevis]RCK70316.1 RNA polymerase sigma factor SigM [Desertihabitans brevis]
MSALPPSGADGTRTDRELLAAHVAGDDTAFAELVRRHSDRLWTLALRTMHNRQDAEDALQEALVSAFRRADTFRGDAAVTTWLHRVVVNACLDRIRRNQVRRTDPLPEHAERVLPATDDPEAETEAGLRRVAVLQALRQLNADQRAALVLVDMEGYSVEEAATILGCAPGTVKSRCFRGRARLAPLLAPLRAHEQDRT